MLLVSIGLAYYFVNTVRLEDVASDAHFFARGICTDSSCDEANGPGDAISVGVGTAGTGALILLVSAIVVGITCVKLAEQFWEDWSQAASSAISRLLYRWRPTPSHAAKDAVEVSSSTLDGSVGEFHPRTAEGHMAA